MAGLAPPNLLPDSLRNETIVITAQELCEIVECAEDYHNPVIEACHEDGPADAECDLSASSSTSTGLA